MRDALRAAVERALGASVIDAHALGGGDIHEAYAVTLRGGERVFIKHSADAPPDMFPAEAAGLAWLAESGAVVTPTVRAFTREDEKGPCFLALELLDPGRR
jgi:fructosamine-3-kinase